MCDRACSVAPCHSWFAAMSTPVLFLHGLGETPQAWNGVINEFESIDALTPTVVDQPSGTPWSLHERTDELAASLNDPVDVVGLSLGAVMGLDLAIWHPHMVRSLFLSAPQARPPKVLMRIQSVLMRVLPERLVCPPQISSNSCWKSCVKYQPLISSQSLEISRFQQRLRAARKTVRIFLPPAPSANRSRQPASSLCQTRVINGINQCPQNSLTN